MIVYLLPQLEEYAEIKYEHEKDEMWVYASKPPREYNWSSYTDGSAAEISYLLMCAMVDRWVMGTDEALVARLSAILKEYEDAHPGEALDIPVLIDLVSNSGI